MLKYAVAIFTGAFLLFQLQPIVGRLLLPRFGGAAGVWTVCLLFFQLAVLAGYLYGHWLTTRCKTATQCGIHLSLLVVSLFVMLIGFDPGVAGGGLPYLSILGFLTATFGLPAILMSATSPLLAKWFSQERVATAGTANDMRTYGLYAVSNLGSLLALALYPFLIEPLLTLRQQTTIWTAVYGTFVAISGLVIVGHLAAAKRTVAVGSEPRDGRPRDGRPRDGRPRHGRPRLGRFLLWLGLACCGTLLLLATTNQICQEIAVVPLLWIVPLAIYLLSYIVCFQNPRWYRRRLFMTLLVLLVLPVTLLLYAGPRSSLFLQVGIYGATLAAGCMVCHGELVRSRPPVAQLTFFYLASALGGALGGVVVAVIAPLLFPGYWEFHLALAATCLMAAIGSHVNRAWSMRRSFLMRQSVGIGFIALLMILGGEMYYGQFGAVVVVRNFYGTLRVANGKDDTGRFRRLAHGRIDHGMQYLDETRRREPTLYFGRGSAVDVCLNEHPRRIDGQPLHVGVVGLGVGTIAAYGKNGDRIRFYELNPLVRRLCDEHFTFVRDSPATVDVVLGDARISLQRELDEQAAQQFDVLIVDAFRNDAIPVHLLTEEAARVYFAHLKPDGLLLIHVSNRYLDLAPVVRGLGRRFDRRVWRLPYAKTATEKAPRAAMAGSRDVADWILVTGNRRFSATADRHARAWSASDADPILWTDDFAALWQVLK